MGITKLEKYSTTTSLEEPLDLNVARLEVNDVVVHFGFAKPGEQSPLNRGHGGGKQKTGGLERRRGPPQENLEP